MKSGLEKRLDALEEKAKPQMIATLADFVLWRASGRDIDIDSEVEISPQLEQVLAEFVKNPKG